MVKNEKRRAMAALFAAGGSEQGSHGTAFFILNHLRPAIVEEAGRAPQARERERRVMQMKPDCDAIAQSNAQLELRQNSLEDQLLDLQNLLDSLYPNDPQRPDLEKKIAQMNQERSSLVDELHKGEVALRDCQQQRQE